MVNKTPGSEALLLTVTRQIDLNDFKTHGRAIRTMVRAKELGKMTELYEYITSLYGTQISESSLNDILSFDEDLLNSLGIED